MKTEGSLCVSFECSFGLGILAYVALFVETLKHVSVHPIGATLEVQIAGGSVGGCGPGSVRPAVSSPSSTSSSSSSPAGAAGLTVVVWSSSPARCVGVASANRGFYHGATHGRSASGGCWVPSMSPLRCRW